MALSSAGMAVRAPGVENPYAGRASFRKCVYGDYLIAMNSSADTTYNFTPGLSTHLKTSARVLLARASQSRPGPP